MMEPRTLSRRERRAVGAVVLGLSALCLFLDLDDEGGTPSLLGGRRSLLGEYAGTPRKRIALIRPFGPSAGEALRDSFHLWDTRWPCLVDDPDYEVDLVLSYSRKIEDDPEAGAVIEAVRDKFLGAGGGAYGEDGDGGWSECFGRLRVIECELDPSQDKYERNPSTGMPESIDWVSGPNGQFRESISQAMAMYDPELETQDEEPFYELAMIMEADNQPQKSGWLNDLLDDVKERTPFSIMGSRYKGRAWDGMKDAMPRSLVDHINGNAFYNLTDPLFRNILGELVAEAGTEYDIIPYDYRISQIVHEGRFGTPPEFPFPWITREDGSKISLVSKKAKLFGRWWKDFGGEGPESPVKDSGVMANFASTNYLPEHVEDGLALVHGLRVYKPLDPETHKFSLVVSAWDDRRDHQGILSELDNAYHPFQEVIVVENPRLQVFNTHFDFLDAELPETSVPVKLQERVALDIVDVCDAPVSTEWFMHTTVYHRVVNDMDLLFTMENPISRPVVPFTPAESLHCESYPGCRETLRIAREIYPELDKVVLDMDMPYHVPSRDAFCKFWKQTYGENGEVLEEREGGRNLASVNQVPITPTATAYVAYLYRTGLAENLYKFTNVLVHGSRPSFVRVDDNEELDEDAAAEPEPQVERKLQREKAAPRVPRDRMLKKGGKPSPPPPSPSPPTPPPTYACPAAGETCAGDGEKAKECGANGGKTPDCCCGDTFCKMDDSGVYTGVCEVSDPSTGGRVRRLSVIEPGFLVEG